VRIHCTRLLLLTTLLLGVCSAASAQCRESNAEPDRFQASGAIYRIYLPELPCWNGDLVIYAHGYVAPNEPLAIPEDQLQVPGGLSIPAIVNALGYAFAVTSYATNGLAIVPALADVRDLVDVFNSAHPRARFVYLVGASEGGLVTTLALERFPFLFNAGLAACGPIGDFRAQLNHFGDFRVIFDYFFPGLLPGNPFQIPPELIENWESVYIPKIRAAIAAHPGRTDQLLRVTQALVGSDPATREQTILGLLRYNVFATNDARTKLGGLSYDNTRTLYVGSANDLLLNLTVPRFAPDAAAIAEVEANYQTTGILVSPLVTIHTTGDPIVPYAHEFLYTLKTRRAGSSLQRANLPIVRYGHCRFTPLEVVIGFALMVSRATGQEPAGVSTLMEAAARKGRPLSLVEQPGSSAILSTPRRSEQPANPTPDTIDFLRLNAQ